MDVSTLIKEAEDEGVVVSLMGDDLLRIQNASDEWEAKLREHQAAIIEHLNGGPPPNGHFSEKCEPFPVHVLPSPVGDYVHAASKAIGCDPSFIALPVLAGLSRAIGNGRVIRLKRTWTEPAII